MLNRTVSSEPDQRVVPRRYLGSKSELLFFFLLFFFLCRLNQQKRKLNAAWPLVISSTFRIIIIAENCAGNLETACGSASAPGR